MASFQELLEKKREAFQGESDRVSIAEAGSEFSSNTQATVEKEYAKIKVDEKSKLDNVSSSVLQLPDQLRGDIEGLEDGSYQDLVRFFKKYDRFNEEVQGGRLYNPDEKEYIKETIQTVVDEMANLQGPVARAAFAFEDFKSQFKPLKLADRFLGELPIIGDIIRDKLQTKNEADRMARQVGLKARKQNLKKDRKDQKSSGSGVFSSVADTSSNLFNMSSDSVGGKLGNLAKNVVTGKGSEESQKEQANVRERELNIFETIMQNTERTNELLEELTEESGDGILDNVIQAVMGNKAAKVGGAAVGTGTGIWGIKKLKDKFFGNKGDKDGKGGKKPASKNTAKILRKSAMKSAIKKIPILGLGAGLFFGAQRLMTGDITGAALEAFSGAASMFPGFGTAASVGADATLAATDIARANKEMNDTADQATTEAIANTIGENVALGQVYQINADQVMLKANSMRQLQNENEVIKRDMAKGTSIVAGGPVTNQVVNNSKSQFLGPSLGSTNPRSVNKSVY